MFGTKKNIWFGENETIHLLGDREGGEEGIELPTHSLIAGSMAKYVELLTIKLKAVETIAYKFT